MPLSFNIYYKSLENKYVSFPPICMKIPWKSLHLTSSTFAGSDSVPRPSACSFVSNPPPQLHTHWFLYHKLYDHLLGHVTALPIAQHMAYTYSSCHWLTASRKKRAIFNLILQKLASIGGNYKDSPSEHSRHHEKVV